MSNSPEEIAPLDYLEEAKATLDTVVLSHREPASEVIALAQAQATIGLLEELRLHGPRGLADRSRRLADRDRKVAAEAWDEGWNVAMHEQSGDYDMAAVTVPTNPYRAARIDQGPGE